MCGRIESNVGTKTLEFFFFLLNIYWELTAFAIVLYYIKHFECID